MSLLAWIYLFNSVLLINHEIDSAYWKEWKLFKLDKLGEKGFLLLHFPLLFTVLYGLILVDRGNTVGFLISIFIAGTGIFAFFIHFYFLRKGRHEFDNWLSKLILILTIPVSIFQIVLTIGKLI